MKLYLSSFAADLPTAKEVKASSHDHSIPFSTGFFCPKSSQAALLKANKDHRLNNFPDKKAKEKIEVLVTRLLLNCKIYDHDLIWT